MHNLRLSKLYRYVSELADTNQTCEEFSASDLHTGYITSRSCTEATGAQPHCWHVLWTPSSFSPVSGVRMKFLGLVADLEGVAGVLGACMYPGTVDKPGLLHVGNPSMRSRQRNWPIS